MMKNLYTIFFLLVLWVLSISPLNAQIQAGSDTLFFIDFEVNSLSDYDIDDSPNGVDNNLVNFDGDGFADASGGNRPGAWFLALAFASADGDNTVLAANSWTTPLEPVKNMFILPPLFIADNSAMLYYKSAPRQTPRFLDGFVVVAQVGSNFENTFNDTLKRYAEFIEGDGGNFANYTFSNGFVHGIDGLYVEFDAASDSARLRGVLRPDSVSLAAYVGQTVYLAFVHNSTDDNLISIDDILVKGTATSSISKINDMPLDIFPNPVAQLLNVSFELKGIAAMHGEIFSNDGRLVRAIPMGTYAPGTHQLQLDLGSLASGHYTLVLDNGKKKSTRQFIKQ